MPNFEQDVSIDPNSLDVEWQKQASLVHKYGILLSDAISERDKAKENLEIVRAEIDLDIRKNFKEYGLEKTTEGAISATILNEKDFIEAQETVHDANHNVNVLQSAKNALEHKKKALEYMTQLYLSGYWAEPKITSEAQEKYSEKDSEKIRKGINRVGKKALRKK